MPDPMTVRQPGFLKRLGAASKHADHYPLGQIIRNLRDGEDVCDVAKRHALLPDTGEESHLRRDWYGGEDSWWPAWPVQDIIRDGYVELLETVQRKRLPVDAHWIEGADEFRTICLVSDVQITFLILTPQHTRRDDDDFEIVDK